MNKNFTNLFSVILLFMICIVGKAQSGTVIFSTANHTNIGSILHDGTYSNDISGIQLDIFGAITTTAATNRTSTGSFPFFTSSELNLTNGGFIPIDLTSGYFTSIDDNIPRIIVIMSHDGSEFNFKGIWVGDKLDSNSPIKFEGFRNGVSTGSVSLSIGEVNGYEMTFTSSNGLTTSIFQNVDEVRISNMTTGIDMAYGIYAAFNNIQIGVATPTVTAISPTSGTSGTSVSITGTNFTGATAVSFGGIAATSYTVNSSTSITAIAPSGSGTVDITVTTSGGTSTTSSSDQFTYYSVPTVTTQAVSSITSTTATGNGNITSLGTPNPTAYGVCWNTSGTPTILDSYINKGSAASTGAFTASITSLLPNTTYYVRAFATNSVGTSYGSSVNFTTSAIAPTASSVAASSITSVAATLNGTVNANNASTTVSFQYGTTSSYGTTVVASQNPVTGTTTTSVTAGISGLTQSTTYHYRVKAVNTAGTSYGGDMTFTTADLPSVSSVFVPSAATYKIGDVLNFYVVMNKTVIVTFTPQLTLTVGSTTKSLSYVSGSGTTTLIFRYTVISGDLDTDGITVGSLSLNGGTIKDDLSNNATLTLNNIGSTTSVFVDGVAPIVSNVTNGSSYTNAVTPTFTEGTATLTKNSGTASSYVSGTTISSSGSYVLTVTDAAGNSTVVSFTLSISTEIADKTENKIILFPNPCTDGFTISTGNQTPVMLEVYNLTGKLLITQSITDGSYVEVNALKAGVYLVKANGHMIKLVKN